MKRSICWVALLTVTSLAGPHREAVADWTTVWQAGAIGRDWRANDGGVQFVQEAGTNPPPGNPNSPVADQQADDDYYFAGTYPDPIGVLATDEIAFERAFAGTDNDLRIHFNLPSDLNPSDQLRFSFGPFNLHEAADVPDSRYGIEIYFNGTLVRPEQIVRPSDLGQAFTTDPFDAGSVGAVGGPGADNVVWLKGINYGAEGGGQWLGLNYHHLEINPIPEPGSLSMLLSGVIWMIPLAFHERNCAKSRR